jgi:hypothetical protein
MDTKNLMAGALAGFLMIGVSPQTWANPLEGSANGATQAPATTNGADRSLLGMLAPILTDPAQRVVPKPASQASCTRSTTLWAIPRRASSIASTCVAALARPGVRVADR